MSTKSTLKLAKELLDRFFRDAEGRTNRQLDVYFTLEDMGVSRDKAETAVEFLASRGLLNTFGPDIAFMTDEGCRVAAEDLDLGRIPRVTRDFDRRASDETTGDAEPSTDDAHVTGSASTGARLRPERPLLTHVGDDGAERLVELAWVCTIGRADGNDIRIDDKRASKHHAEVRYEDGRYVLHDLESANGTLLNGEYVLEPCPVDHEDEIVIGRTLLLFLSPDVVPQPTGDPPAAPAPFLGATPAPDLGSWERPAFGEPTPIPPSIPIFQGHPETYESVGFQGAPAYEPPTWDPPSAAEPPREPTASESTTDAPPARGPGSAEDEPEMLDPEDLMTLDPEDEIEMAEGARVDPEDVGHPETAPEAFADTVQSLPEDDLDDAATIMTTRAALWGTGGVPRPDGGATDGPRSPEGRPEPAPQSEPAPEPELEMLPTEEAVPTAAAALGPDEASAPRADEATDPSLAMGLEPAVLTLLGHIRESLVAARDLPDRDRLLEAVDLLRSHRDIARLARSIEDEFGEV